MDCPNCSAPLQIDVESQLGTCGFCGTQKSIQPAAGGDANVGGLLCPCCQNGLKQATVQSADAEATVDYCVECAGLLVHVNGFRLLTDTKPTAHGEETSFVLNRALSCPGCQQAMDCHLHDSGSNVSIDVCKDCRYVWLDAGELDQIQTERRHADDEDVKLASSEQNSQATPTAVPTPPRPRNDSDDSDEWERPKRKAKRKKKRKRHSRSYWSKLLDDFDFDFELDDLFDWLEDVFDWFD